MPPDGLKTIAAHVELGRMVKACPGTEAHAGYIIRACFSGELKIIPSVWVVLTRGWGYCLSD